MRIMSITTACNSLLIYVLKNGNLYNTSNLELWIEFIHSTLSYPLILKYLTLGPTASHFNAFENIFAVF
jgi:hypothetical protein